MHPASIAAATWTYGTRTLATGSPAAPTDRAGRIAKAVWEYTVRTLAEGPVSGGSARATVGGFVLSALPGTQSRVSALPGGGDGGA